MAEELRASLHSQDVDVSLARTAEGVPAVVARAPDLVVLADTSRSGEGAMLSPLSAHPSSSVVPVVVLGAAAQSPGALSGGFSHGVVGRVAAGREADLVATEVLQILADLPRRRGHTEGPLAESSLDALVELLASELQSGILSVRGDRDAHIALRSGRPLSGSFEDFKQRVRPLLTGNGSASFSFREHEHGRLASVPAPPADQPRTAPHDLRGRRLMLFHTDPNRAERWQKALEHHGARVLLLHDAQQLGAARAFDPEVMIVESTVLDTSDHSMIELVQGDDRLRWAATLLLPPDEGTASVPPPEHVSGVTEKVAELCQPQQDLAMQMRESSHFETRLELVGPAQLLRIAIDSGRAIELRVQHPGAQLDLTIAEGEIRRALGVRHDHGKLELGGQQALNLLLSLRRARVTLKAIDEGVPAAQDQPLSLDPTRFERPEPLDSEAPGPLISAIPPPPRLPSNTGTHKLVILEDEPPENGSSPLLLGLTLTALAVAIALMVLQILTR
ncbi:MAG: hypothetical protein OEZ06_28465 [Myxococcales bacterium]|nr:hypothetical protein [Myxococcales bacterium]